MRRRGTMMERGRRGFSAGWAMGGVMVCALLTGPVVAAEQPLVAMGVTEPLIDVALSASVPGIVSTQHFEEGDAVQAGNVILELDKRLEELEVDRRRQVMTIRKADLEATETLYERTSAVPKEELDKKRADYLVSVAEYEMAVEQLNRRQVLAPHGGIITDITLDVGEAAEAYQPLIRLVDPTRCRFESNLDARMAARLKLGQTVRLEVATGEGMAPVTGTVAFISPVADKASGLINVKVTFDNLDGRFRPGVAGRIIITD